MRQLPIASFLAAALACGRGPLPGTYVITGDSFYRLHYGTTYTASKGPGGGQYQLSLDGAWPERLERGDILPLLDLRPDILPNFAGAFFGEAKYGGATLDYAILLRPEPRALVGTMHLGDDTFPVSFRFLRAGPGTGERNLNVMLGSNIKTGPLSMDLPAHFSIGLELHFGPSTVPQELRWTFVDASLAILPCHVQADKWTCSATSLSILDVTATFEPESPFFPVESRSSSLASLSIEGISSDTRSLLKQELEERRRSPDDSRKEQRACITETLQFGYDCLFCPVESWDGDAVLRGTPVKDSRGLWYCPIVRWEENVCYDSQVAFSLWLHKWLVEHVKTAPGLRRLEGTQIAFYPGGRVKALDDGENILVGVAPRRFQTFGIIRAPVTPCRVDLRGLENALLSRAGTSGIPKK